MKDRRGLEACGAENEGVKDARDDKERIARERATAGDPR